MSRYERRYKNGEVIFREGEPSRSAYVLVSGQIELIKENGSTPIRLALLQLGEMFGEMGLVDNSPRSATARAVIDVVVDLVEKEEFLQAVKETPDVALTVIGNLAERLRATNELVLQPSKKMVVETRSPRRGDVWDQFRQLMEGGKAPVATLKILVAQLHRDDDQIQSKRIAQALSRLKNVPCLSGYHPHPLYVVCTHFPE